MVDWAKVLNAETLRYLLTVLVTLTSVAVGALLDHLFRSKEAEQQRRFRIEDEKRLARQALTLQRVAAARAYLVEVESGLHALSRLRLEMVQSRAVQPDRLQALRQVYDNVSTRWGVLLEPGDGELKAMAETMLTHYVQEHESTEALARLPADARPSAASEINQLQGSHAFSFDMLARLRHRLDQIQVVA